MNLTSAEIQFLMVQLLLISHHELSRTDRALSNSIMKKLVTQLNNTKLTP